MDVVDSRKSLIVSRLADLMKEMSGLPDCWNLYRKMHGNLVRRIKLLSPLIEELKDNPNTEVGEGEINGLEKLVVALNSALEHLHSVGKGSKLYQALQNDEITTKFQLMNLNIEAALGEISYGKLNLPEEVTEQIELVHAQFRRAKESKESLDGQLVNDLSIARRQKDLDHATLKRLSEKLQIRTGDDIKKEYVAFHELVVLCEGVTGDWIEIMTSLLKKLKDHIQFENPVTDTSQAEKSSMRYKSPVIPDDFRCPISLELMMDPVIVSTGQTYERSSIQKWFDAGHKTCPKTQQTIVHTALTPNYVLKSLIALWCESNGVELPKSCGPTQSRRLGHSLDCNHASIKTLLTKLENGSTEQKRAAAGELRLLAKRNGDNRLCIAEAGAIPLLVELLSSPDSRTQEHAVTALLNLSIHDNNKVTIVRAGAIPDIVDVLIIGSMEARENAAATLFSLSTVDENKMAIGSAGAIPALVQLLSDGTLRGKKDAATAIFNLSFYQGNKVRAVRAGIVPLLMALLMDTGSGMVDESLAILAIIASHQEGKHAIRLVNPVPTIINFIRAGSPRNRENAGAILWSLCTGDLNTLKIMRECGVEDALKELLQNGTDRAKRKAGSIIEFMQRADVIANHSSNRDRFDPLSNVMNL